MRRDGGSPSDSTGNQVLSNLSSESLFAELLSRIYDKKDRVLVLAHIGLEIPLVNLSRTLGITRSELEQRLNKALKLLREDEDLAEVLGDLRRAGRIENYQALTFRLGLQDWFCELCGQFMIQPVTGFARKMCSEECRKNWTKLSYEGLKQRHSGLVRGQRRIVPEQQALQPPIPVDVLQKLVQPILNAAPHSVYGPGQLLRTNGRWEMRFNCLALTHWSNPDVQSRDLAIILLGLQCPVPLTPRDLSRFEISDVVLRPGREIRLRIRSALKSHPVRYVSVAASKNATVCPVAALSAWLRRLSNAGHRLGPLFLRIDPARPLTQSTAPMTPAMIARTAGKIIYFRRPQGVWIETTTQLRSPLEGMG